MGLGYECVEAIVREHKYRPITGNVIIVGRQTVYFTPEQILKLLREHCVDVEGVQSADLDIDLSTTNRHYRFRNIDSISDSELFRLIGVPKVLALDHSDYEGADIVHDLTKPIPPDLRGCADFIVDGSTLDNVFDPAMVIRNLAEMLKPGGRLITTNVFSNDYEPYVIIPPFWFMDYFITNGFNDCKVYVLVYSSDKLSDTNVFTFNVDMLLDPTKTVSAFTSPRMMATIVLAEKGIQSTSNVAPVQQHYRSEEDWVRYRQNLREIQKNPRPHIVRSLGDINFFDVKGGHLFVANDFTARDPTTEILKLKPLTSDAE